MGGRWFSYVQAGRGLHKLLTASSRETKAAASLFSAPNVSLTANLFQMRAVWGCQSCWPAVCQFKNMNHSHTRACNVQSSVCMCVCVQLSSQISCQPVIWPTGCSISSLSKPAIASKEDKYKYILYNCRIFLCSELVFYYKVKSIGRDGKNVLWQHRLTWVICSVFH